MIVTTKTDSVIKKSGPVVPLQLVDIFTEALRPELNKFTIYIPQLERSPKRANSKGH